MVARQAAGGGMRTALERTPLSPPSPVQEREVRLADDDVIGRGVGVQLLVPLLQEGFVVALRGGGGRG